MNTDDLNPRYWGPAPSRWEILRSHLMLVWMKLRGWA